MNAYKQTALRFLAVLAPLLLLAAKPLSLEEVVARLQNNYNKVNSYSARFSQEVTSTSFDRTISKGKGEVIFLKPGKMYWRYSEPEEHLYITDGETLWDYLPEEKQVTVLKVSSVIKQNLPRAFLFGMGELKEQFEISFHSGRITDAEGNYWLELVPKKDEEREALGTIQLWVDPKDFIVKDTELLDSLGNRNRLSFTEIKMNPKVDENIFTFKPPKNVEVIEPSLVEPEPQTK